MDERILALCELSNDLLFHKIPARQRAFYVDMSLEAGKSAAAALQGQNIEELYKQHGIRIISREEGKKTFGVLLRGQAAMGPDGCSVEIYEQSVSELADGEQLDAVTARQVHLAHEFFHFLEYKSGKTVSEELPPVETMRILGISRKAHINRCSEVAAHSFARELLGLKELPNYYDYHYLLRTNKMTAVQWEQTILEMQNMLA